MRHLDSPSCAIHYTELHPVRGAIHRTGFGAEDGPSQATMLLTVLGGATDATSRGSSTSGACTYWGGPRTGNEPERRREARIARSAINLRLGCESGYTAPMAFPTGDLTRRLVVHLLAIHLSVVGFCPCPSATASQDCRPVHKPEEPKKQGCCCGGGGRLRVSNNLLCRAVVQRGSRFFFTG
jgi:hypothetical protein